MKRPTSEIPAEVIAISQIVETKEMSPYHCTACERNDIEIGKDMNAQFLRNSEKNIRHLEAAANSSTMMMKM